MRIRKRVSKVFIIGKDWRLKFWILKNSWVSIFFWNMMSKILIFRKGIIFFLWQDFSCLNKSNTLYVLIIILFSKSYNFEEKLKIFISNYQWLQCYSCSIIIMTMRLFFTPHLGNCYYINWTYLRRVYLWKFI